MRLFMFFALAFLSNGASAQDYHVYQYIDKAGVLHLTNKAPPEDKVELLYQRSYRGPTHLGNQRNAAPEQPFYWNGHLTFWLPALPETPAVAPQAHPVYANLVDATARQYGLEPALLRAVVQAESAYNPQAVSPKGAIGLLQLMPGTATRYGVADPYEPTANLDGGARYLRDLLALFGQDLRLALAAYNAGEGAVLKHARQIPPYPETQAYVERVLALYQRLSASSAQ